MSNTKKDSRRRQTGRESGGKADAKAAQEENVLIVVHGPPGSGKTYHAEALKKHFGARMVFDESVSGPLGKVPAIKGRVLALVNDLTQIHIGAKVKREVWSIDQALGMAGLTKFVRKPSLESEMVAALKEMVGMARFLDLPSDAHFGRKCALTVARAEGVLERWVMEKGGAR